MLEAFKNPNKEYRPIPFWSWNGKLEKQTLTNQIKEMHKQGIGGYFMHARSGLKTQYLSKEWFNCVKACIEQGKECQMDSWLYDEEGWPSGFAGGKVTGKGEEYQAKTLHFKIYETTNDIQEEHVLGVYVLNEKNSYSKLEQPWNYVCSKNESLFVAYVVINPYYIDVGSKKAVDCFIEETHEQYHKEFANEFGTHMKGFFTDEPRFVTNGTGNLPWSNELESEFLSQHGYCVLDCLPSLFLEVGQTKKIRYDFWETITHLFGKNFMKNIYDWCTQHNCQLTGHIMMEESLYSQMASTGGVMHLYEYMHIPGIDWLRRMIADPNTPKQVGSVASQLGKKHVITESFALCGWDVTFEELKWIAQWQYVNGVNLLCQHLQAYSILGARKRDYPPSLFVQQTWWEQYHLFNDYMARLGFVLTQGNEECEVLLIHPIRSAWVAYNGASNEEITQLDDSLRKISNELTQAHITYHYGDETILSKHGKVENGHLIVGNNAYSSVALPLLYALDKKTIELLLHFITQGGKVVALAQKPTFTNGEQATLLQLNNNTIQCNVLGLQKMFSQKNISITQNNQQISDIACQKRICQDEDILFMVNHSQQNAYQATITLPKAYSSVSLMECETGNINPIHFVLETDATTFELAFMPMQSYVVMLGKQQTQCVIATSKQEKIPTKIIALTEQWNIEQMDLNSLTLDYCTYKIDNAENWSEKTHTILLMDILLKLQRRCLVQMKFEFDIHEDFNMHENQEFFVVIEKAESFGIEVNGKKITYRNCGYWKDEGFQKVCIKDFIQKGRNEIVLTCDFCQSPKVYEVLFGKNVYETERNKLHYDTELESIYLLGNFGVFSKTEFVPRERNALETKGNFYVSNMQKTLNGNLFTTQGLAFFAGKITVSQQFYAKMEKQEQTILKLNKPFANMVEVAINEKPVKTIIWAPYEADISDATKDGENKVSLTLYSSNRNLFGPHHHSKGESYKVGPDSFNGKWSWVERESEAFVNLGMDRNTNYWTDNYCFVQFGFDTKN